MTVTLDTRSASYVADVPAHTLPGPLTFERTRPATASVIPADVASEVLPVIVRDTDPTIIRYSPEHPAAAITVWRVSAHVGGGYQTGHTIRTDEQITGSYEVDVWADGWRRFGEVHTDTAEEAARLTWAALAGSGTPFLPTA